MVEIPRSFFWRSLVRSINVCLENNPYGLISCYLGHRKRMKYVSAGLLPRHSLFVARLVFGRRGDSSCLIGDPKQRDNRRL